MKIKSSKWNGKPAAYAHLKLDGHFTRMIKRDGIVRVLTSRPTDITEQVPLRLKYPIARRAPDNTVVLGELHVAGKPASYIKTALKEQSDSLQFTAFAIESYDHEAPLEEIYDLCCLWGIRFADFKRLTDGWDPDDLLIEAKKHGAEGWMLKDGNILNWMKLKHEQTVDAVVTGYEDGDGKYIGLVGSLRVSLEGKEIANVSGMDDVTRVWITNNIDNVIGRVIEVKYQYVGSQGRLRHPVFVRFRDDKLPDECTMDQL